MNSTPTSKANAPTTPVAKTQTAPASSNTTKTDTQIAYVNGVAHPIIQGETILAMLRRVMGPEPVPTLCDAPNLEPFGSCRVCSVEVALVQDDPSKVMASCHTPVANGQFITTHNERMKRLRRNIVELVLSNYPTEQTGRRRTMVPTSYTTWCNRSVQHR
ncbi:MAG: (2Fe-2S)-binding protein [Flavobacteriales bacterium]|nr:(2Fe-2S)-binding protein [Flavobacteriales bacterium]